jgi:hypothetical protein
LKGSDPKVLAFEHASKVCLRGASGEHDLLTPVCGLRLCPAWTPMWSAWIPV